jgi:hypothetical protein
VKNEKERAHMLIYLGAPIDCADDPGANFRELSELALSVFPDAVLYDPFSAFINAKAAAGDAKAVRHVVDLNERALKNSDLALFVWNDTPSFGVPLEIQFCTANNKDCMVLYKSVKDPGLYFLNALSQNCAESRYSRSKDELLEYLTDFKNLLQLSAEYNS